MINCGRQSVHCQCRNAEQEQDGRQGSQDLIIVDRQTKSGGWAKVIHGQTTGRGDVVWSQARVRHRQAEVTKAGSSGKPGSCTDNEPITEARSGGKSGYRGEIRQERGQAGNQGQDQERLKELFKNKLSQKWVVKQQGSQEAQGQESQLAEDHPAINGHPSMPSIGCLAPDLGAKDWMCRSAPVLGRAPVHADMCTLMCLCLCLCSLLTGILFLRTGACGILLVS